MRDEVQTVANQSTNQTEATEVSWCIQSSQGICRQLIATARSKVSAGPAEQVISWNQLRGLCSVLW